MTAHVPELPGLCGHLTCPASVFGLQGDPLASPYVTQWWVWTQAAHQRPWSLELEPDSKGNPKKATSAKGCQPAVLGPPTPAVLWNSETEKPFVG